MIFFLCVPLSFVIGIFLSLTVSLSLNVSFLVFSRFLPLFTSLFTVTLFLTYPSLLPALSSTAGRAHSTTTSVFKMAEKIKPRFSLESEQKFLVVKSSFFLFISGRSTDDGWQFCVAQSFATPSLKQQGGKILSSICGRRQGL